MTISSELLVIFGLLGGLGLILAVISTILSIYSLVKVMAMEKSTHTVQLMPVDEDIDKHNQKIMEEWATSEESIAKQQKMYREDLEDEMPELYEDKPEVISF